MQQAEDLEDSIKRCRLDIEEQDHLSSIWFGGTMVPKIELDYILRLGYSIFYKEYNLTGFNHQKNTTHRGVVKGTLRTTWRASGT